MGMLQEFLHGHGDGRRMLPVKMETRRGIGIEVGKIVEVTLQQRIRA